MLSVWNACETARVEIPDEVIDFFDGEYPMDKPGMEVSLVDAATNYNSEWL